MTFRDIFMLFGKLSFSYKIHCSVQIYAQMGLHADGTKNITTKDSKNKNIINHLYTQKVKDF